MYNTTSMLRTMELILGLRPMTHFDAGARPMTAAFQSDREHRPVHRREAAHRAGRAQSGGFSHGCPLGADGFQRSGPHRRRRIERHSVAGHPGAAAAPGTQFLRSTRPMPHIYLCFLWHMHQPFYKDLVSGEYKLPWTRHARAEGLLRHGADPGGVSAGAPDLQPGALHDGAGGGVCRGRGAATRFWNWRSSRPRA